MHASTASPYPSGLSGGSSLLSSGSNAAANTHDIVMLAARSQMLRDIGPPPPQIARSPVPPLALSGRHKPGTSGGRKRAQTSMTARAPVEELSIPSLPTASLTERSGFPDTWTVPRPMPPSRDTRDAPTSPAAMSKVLTAARGTRSPSPTAAGSRQVRAVSHSRGTTTALDGFTPPGPASASLASALVKQAHADEVRNRPQRFQQFLEVSSLPPVGSIASLPSATAPEDPSETVWTRAWAKAGVTGFQRSVVEFSLPRVAALHTESSLHGNPLQQAALPLDEMAEEYVPGISALASRWRDALLVSHKPASRADAIYLLQLLDGMLANVATMETAAASEQEEVVGFPKHVLAEMSVWSVVLAETVRQAHLHCEEQGVLLQRARTRLFELLYASNQYCKELTLARQQAEAAMISQINQLQQQIAEETVALKAAQEAVKTTQDQLEARTKAMAAKEQEFWEREIRLKIEEAESHVRYSRYGITRHDVGVGEPGEVDWQQIEDWSIGVQAAPTMQESSTATNPVVTRSVKLQVGKSEMLDAELQAMRAAAKLLVVHLKQKSSERAGEQQPADTNAGGEPESTGVQSNAQAGPTADGTVQLQAAPRAKHRKHRRSSAPHLVRQLVRRRTRSSSVEHSSAVAAATEATVQTQTQTDEAAEDGHSDSSETSGAPGVPQSRRHRRNRKPAYRKGHQRQFAIGEDATPGSTKNPNAELLDMSSPLLGSSRSILDQDNDDDSETEDSSNHGTQTPAEEQPIDGQVADLEISDDEEEQPAPVEEPVNMPRTPVRPRSRAGSVQSVGRSRSASLTDQAALPAIPPPLGKRGSTSSIAAGEPEAAPIVLSAEGAEEAVLAAIRDGERAAASDPHRRSAADIAARQQRGSVTRQGSTHMFQRVIGCTCPCTCGKGRVAAGVTTGSGHASAATVSVAAVAAQGLAAAVAAERAVSVPNTWLRFLEIRALPTSRNSSIALLSGKVLTMTILQVYAQKIKADKIGVGERSVLQAEPLPAFVLEFFQRQFGTPKLVRDRLLSFTYSLRKQYTTNRYASLFVRLCGMKDPLPSSALVALLTGLSIVFDAQVQQTPLSLMPPSTPPTSSDGAGMGSLKNALAEKSPMARVFGHTALVALREVAKQVRNMDLYVEEQKLRTLLAKNVDPALDLLTQRRRTRSRTASRTVTPGSVSGAATRRSTRVQQFGFTDIARTVRVTRQQVQADIAVINDEQEPMDPVLAAAVRAGLEAGQNAESSGSTLVNIAELAAAAAAAAYEIPVNIKLSPTAIAAHRQAATAEGFRAGMDASIGNNDAATISTVSALAAGRIMQTTLHILQIGNGLRVIMRVQRWFRRWVARRRELEDQARSNRVFKSSLTLSDFMDFIIAAWARAYKLTTARLNTIFNKADANSNGIVEYQEFAVLVNAVLQELAPAGFSVKLPDALMRRIFMKALNMVDANFLTREACDTIVNPFLVDVVAPSAIQQLTKAAARKEETSTFGSASPPQRGRRGSITLISRAAAFAPQ